MSKQRRTFSIDEDIDNRFKQQEHLNASATVNKLLREYVAAGKEPEAALNVRLREVESELQQKREEKARIESHIERLEREKDDIAAKIREREKNQQKPVMDFVELVKRTPNKERLLDADNDALEKHAERANLTPTRFLEKVEAEL
jgi:DNA anti-recombination protein RmuC